MLKTFWCILFGLFFISLPSLAVTQAITYQGRIIKPNGMPLESESVNFVLRVIVPNKNCALYVENQNSIPMTSGDGSFLLLLGKGTKVGNNPVALADIFSPNLTIPPGTTECLAGYTRSVGDSYQLQVSFDDGSGGQTLAGIDMTTVPLTFETVNVGGVASESVLRVSGQSAPPLTSGKYTELLALLDGTSTQYAKNGQSTGGGGGTVTGVSSAGAPILVGGTATAPTIGITAANATTSGYLTSADWNFFNGKLNASTFNNAVAAANCTSGQTMYWNSPASAFACANIAITSNQVSGLLTTSAPTVGFIPYFSTTSTLANSSLFVSGSNVGIGTTSPQDGLQITTNAGTNLAALTTGVHAGVATIASQDYAYISLVGHAPLGGSFIDFHDAQNDGEADFRLKTNGTTLQLFTSNNSGSLGSSPMLTFLGNGNVGIGNANPTSKLEINGTVNASGFTINGVPVATSSSTYWSQSSANVYYNTGNVGIGTSTPEAKLSVEENKVADKVGLIVRNSNTTDSTSHAFIKARTELGGGNSFAVLGLQGVTNWQIGAIRSENALTIGRGGGDTDLTQGRFVTIASDGKVGIGTTTPSGSLTIAGSTSSTNPEAPDYAKGILIQNTNTTNATYSPLGFLNSTGQIAAGIMAVHNNTTGTYAGGTPATNKDTDLYFQTSNPNNNGAINTRMVIKNAGNVGIGTTGPGARLEVAGVTGTFADFASYSGTTANSNWPNSKIPELIVSRPWTGTSFAGSNSTYRGGLGLGAGVGIYSVNPNPDGSPFYGDIRFHNTVWNGSTYQNYDRMIINLSGNVGIGTNSPVARLEVMNGSISGDTQFARFSSAGGSTGGTGYVTVGDGTTGGGYIGWDYGANALVINSHTAGGSVGGLVVKRIDNGYSRVGIGTTSPNYRLDVAGDINTSSCFRIGATTVSGTCTSDARLKENIQDFKPGLGELLGIRVRTYQFNGLGEMPKTGETAVGVIAQEVEQTNPGLVKTKDVYMHPTDQQTTEIKVVDYSKFLYMLINAVKELYAKIVTLTNEQQSLSSQLAGKAEAAEVEQLHRQNQALKQQLDAVELKYKESTQQNQQLKDYLCSKDHNAPLCH